MQDPKPYNMKNLTDRKRWFREMKGYFRVGDFLDAGTDFEGRKYAMEGFLELEKICCQSPSGEEATCGNCEFNKCDRSEVMKKALNICSLWKPNVSKPEPKGGDH